FVTAGDFACDHRRAQLAFGQVVSGLNAVVIQKGKEMVALLLQAVSPGFFAWFAAGGFQELDRRGFPGLGQVVEGFGVTLGLCVLGAPGPRATSLRVQLRSLRPGGDEALWLGGWL